MKIEIRYQQLSDAKRFFEILKSLNTPFFKCPKNLEEEKEKLRKNIKGIKKNQRHDFGIIYNGALIGGATLKLDNIHKDTVEAGYFVEKSFQRKGIATKTVKLLEKFAFNNLKKTRIEIRTDIRNKSSQKVAIKSGYKKEGKINTGKKEKGEYTYDYIYGKVKN